METPLGPITVNDSHCHFFSHSFLKAVAGQKFQQGDVVGQAIGVLGWEAPPEGPVDLARRWIAELDRHGVARAALIASVPGDEDSVAAAVGAFPDRFVGFFMLDPTEAGAPERARRALDQLRLRCVCLFPAMQRYVLDDDRVRAVLEAVNEQAAGVVFVHCGVLTVGIRKKLALPSPFDLRCGNPLALSTIAALYPRIRFIIPHLGAGLLRETLMLAEVCPNVYLDMSSSNSWLRYLGISLKEAIHRALAVAGPERLLFGTDSSFFPRGWQKKILDTQLAILQELAVDPAAIKAILGGNFDRLFPVDR